MSDNPTPVTQEQAVRIIKGIEEPTERRWFQVMLVFPVETLAWDAEDAIEEAIHGFLTELSDEGLDVAHDLLATDANDVYPIDAPSYDDEED